MTPTPSGPRRTSHTAFEELAVGYALHALEPEDEMRFTAHLAGCEDCQEALRRHDDDLAAMAAAAPQSEPPPQVLAGILAALDAEEAPATGAGPATPRPRTPAPAPADELAARRRAAVTVPRAWLLTAAAGVTALVLGLGAWATVLQSQRDAADARGDRLAAAVAELERPDTRTVSLESGDGVVQAVVVADGTEVSLVVDGLAPTGDDSVYVLWGQDGSGGVRALAAFDVPRPGLDVLDRQVLPVRVGELTTLMVTRERGRTMPEQTTEPAVLVGKV